MHVPAPTAETLIDLVDEHDRPAGLVPRGEVFDRRASFRVVHVLLFDAKGKLLVQQLGAQRERHPLQWGSSVAAFLHAGESYEQAATRRTREEIGLQPALQPVGRTSMTDEGSTKFIGVYTGTIDRNAPTIREPEHIERIAFVSLDRLRGRLHDDPDSFTETFRHVLRFWEQQRAAAAAR